MAMLMCTGKTVMLFQQVHTEPSTYRKSYRKLFLILYFMSLQRVVLIIMPIWNIPRWTAGLLNHYYNQHCLLVQCVI